MFEQRLLFVTGKGGVGKSTVAATLALKLASEGRRVLLALCNTKERISGLFGTGPIESQIAQVHERIWAVNMRPQEALQEYGLLALKSRTLTSVLFDNRYVQSFFRAVPGMQEWTLLGKAWWHTTEERAEGGFTYDTVIIDGPATGHGLDMLRVPKVIVDLVPPGILRRDAERAWTMFQNPREFGVVLVTLPEDLPATETLELAGALRTELGLPIAHLVINAQLNPLFMTHQSHRPPLDALFEQMASSESNLLRDVGALAQMRLYRERSQQGCNERLQELALPTSQLPVCLHGVRGMEDLKVLKRALDRSE